MPHNGTSFDLPWFYFFFKLSPFISIYPKIFMVEIGENLFLSDLSVIETFHIQHFTETLF